VVKLAGVRDNARIGGVHTVHVGIDFANVSVQGDGEGDGSGIRTAASQCGDVLGVLGDALEACD
jgi:hypothetical protein